MAVRLGRDPLEAAINEADKRGLVDPEGLRSALDQVGRRPGVGVLRKVLDYRTFTLTQSHLERILLPIARRAGLDKPETGMWLHGFQVDFFWRGLGLVVETDGLRYHRTAQQQARDRVRDQSLTAMGLTVLRFTRAQVRYEPGYVEGRLRQVAEQLRERLAIVRRQ
jgi:very-short-patch-repair endonuclease